MSAHPTTLRETLDSVRQSLAATIGDLHAAADAARALLGLPALPHTMPDGTLPQMVQQAHAAMAQDRKSVV